MSNSVEQSNDVRKPGPVAVIASKRPIDQPREVVARICLAYITSKPLGEYSGSMTDLLGTTPSGSAFGPRRPHRSVANSSRRP
jgi:hypothetical protein